MKTKEIIGIDVSKLTLDICLHSTQQLVQLKNSKEGFEKMILWLEKHTDTNHCDYLFVYEDTGMYSYKLGVFLTQKEYPFHKASGLEIKRSMGIQRGKDDQIDSKRIALYGYRLREELQSTILPEGALVKLKGLISLRTKLVRQRASFKTSLNEQKNIYSIKEYKHIFRSQNNVINLFTREIKKIEIAIDTIVNSISQLEKNTLLIQSIKGVGRQTAVQFLIYTDNFKKFKTWRNFASYCGVAPFPYKSGTSVRGRTKVSHMANKQLKALLTMCAISAIQFNPEMKAYYQKRVLEGKNKMSTINIIRNKIIARVFAVVKRQTPYVDTMKFAA